MKTPAIFFKQYFGKEVHFLKFLRRPDIDCSARFDLGYQVLYRKQHGSIVRLSKEYGVSRTFLYRLGAQLEQWRDLIFGVWDRSLFEQCSDRADEELLTIGQLLSLRLEGHCPISGIHLLLKRGGYLNNSVGYISGILNEIGSQLPSQVCLPEGTIQFLVVFASDEIFSKNTPILITVDPVSSAILRMELVENRTAENWEAHWQSLLDKGVTPLLLVNDEGTAMKKAHQSVFPEVTRQSDTFHVIAYRLGDECRKLLNKAFKSIEKEYDRERVYENRKTIEAALEKEEQYQQAIQNSQKAIENYEQFCFLYQYMIESLAFFDAKGQPNSPQKAQADIQAAVDQIRQLDCCHSKMQKQLNTIQKLLPNLVGYLSVVQQTVQNWKPVLNTEQKQEAFQLLCQAYQYIKNSRKHKHNKTKRYFLHLAKQCQQEAQKLLQEDRDNIDVQLWIQKLYEQLEQIQQSSAMVETINSILRTYLNDAKNQLNQNHLNLIMFYLNHRRYLRGKRKGYTPMELLTGQKQKQDWLELLLKEVQLKNRLLSKAS